MINSVSIDSSQLIGPCTLKDSLIAPLRTKDIALMDGRGFRPSKITQVNNLVGTIMTFTNQAFSFHSQSVCLWARGSITITLALSSEALKGQPQQHQVL